MHPFRASLIAVASAALGASAALAQSPELPRTTAPEGASVYIISPANGRSESIMNSRVENDCFSR